MSNSNDEVTTQQNTNENISEKELYEIFEFQYDDLFCKILKITEKSFLSFLKQQVLFQLQIINKNVVQKILKAYLDLFAKRYKENLKLVQSHYNIIKEKMQKENNDLIYLDVTNCYIHCHKCFNIIHKCGKKLVLYEDFIYCIKCNNVYNKNQILLFCPECKKNYLSKIRKPVFNGNKKFEKLFLTKFKKYHCNTNKEEKIKCLKCSNNLYFRLSQHNSDNESNINIIYCIKCKLKYSIKDVFFKCKLCLKNFKGEAKLFRDFSKKEKNILFLIHTLLRNKNVLPNNYLYEKNCKCDLKTITEYYHNEDNGKLIEGLKNNKKSVVCNKCFTNFKYDEMKWNCPKCQSEFRYKKNKNKIHSSNDFIELSEENEILESRKIPVFKVNLSKKDSNQENNVNNKEKIEEQSININNNNLNSNINDNNIRVIINKNENQIKNINLNFNNIKSKNIYIKQNVINKNIKTKYAMRKSRSKNDIAVKKNQKNNNDIAYLNSKQTKKNKIDNKSKSKSKNNDKNFEDYQNKSEKNNEKEDIKEKNIKKENDQKTEEHKSIDTKEIFNQIRDNIYNFDDDSYYMFSPDVTNKKLSQKKILIDKKDKNIIKPKHKNTQYFYNDELNKNNLYREKSFILSQEGLDKNEIFKQSEINNNEGNNKDINRKMQSTGNFDNIQLESDNDNNKRHIRYTKKIYLYNSKNPKIIDGNNNYFQPENNLSKYMKNSYFNRNQKHNHNLYGNDNEYLFSNDSSFQNFDNYEINYQNNINYHQLNLYNFNSENYSIIKLLGKGANGKIYLVSDMQTKQNYAIKSILIDNELDIKMLEEEYNLIYELIYENPELKIVNIYGLEVRRINKFSYFFNVLMEAALSDWEVEIISRKKKNRYYTEEELFYILANLIGTLSYLQEKNISHRDLKPQNILYFGNNEYKICDFGEAKYADDKKNQSSNINFDDSKQTIRGTQLYMSPILFKAVKYKPDSLTKYNSFKSDVFSLGLCFLHASSLDSDILYKIREITDMKKIIDIVNNYLGKRYSQNYINFLLNMLQIDENSRPDFIELNSWLLFDTN